MGVCWHCYWGWPKIVADIYNAARAKCGYDVLHFGPSHIVWEDENWDNNNILWCIEETKKEKYITEREFSQEEIDICRWSLEELLKIPFEERNLEPEDYDNEHPENYPPPKHITMVRV
jgi:hypothetical protein